METLVTIIYLAAAPAEIHRISRAATKIRNPISFRERFDKIIPGYYETHYKLSSEFVHPGFASHILKVAQQSDGTAAPERGVVFNERSMSMCMNELSVLLAGLLRVFLEKFSGQLKFREARHEDSARQARRALAELIDSHIRFVGENDWHRFTRPLWDCGTIP